MSNKDEDKISQGFDCEVDSKDWVLYEQDGAGLRISMQSESAGEVEDVFLGPGQVDNMIAFLNKLRSR